MDGPSGYHVYCNKRAKQTLYIFTYMWNLNYKTNESIPKKAETDSQIQRTNYLWGDYQWAERSWDKIKKGIKTYELLCIK